MSKKKLIMFIFIILNLIKCFSEIIITEKDYKSYFEDIDSDGCIVIYDSNNDKYCGYNISLCRTGIIPAQTFTIYNTMIALDKGIIEKESRLNIVKSALWRTQEVVDDIGVKEMKENLNSLGYGNNNLISDLEGFWTDGSLLISPLEQVRLLKRLRETDLPFCKDAQEILKQLLVLEEANDYRLSGKSSSIYDPNNRYNSWFIGYLETKYNVYYFATNLYKTKNEKGILESKKVTLAILEKMGIM